MKRAYQCTDRFDLFVVEPFSCSCIHSGNFMDKTTQTFVFGAAILPSAEAAFEMLQVNLAPRSWTVFFFKGPSGRLFAIHGTIDPA